jgi:hypothetical protein
MVQQLLLVGLALSSIWEKARARDRQREVAGDKGQRGFVLQGMRPAVAQAAEWWQGVVFIIIHIINCLLNFVEFSAYILCFFKVIPLNSFPVC